jgi:hypothetical protein
LPGMSSTAWSPSTRSASTLTRCGGVQQVGQYAYVRASLVSQQRVRPSGQ